MYQLANTPDHRIAQYTFGKSISQFGMTVLVVTRQERVKRYLAMTLILRGNMYWTVRLI